MKEEWKNIDGFDGLYQISNLSRIKSLKFGKEKIMKQVVHKNGYSLLTIKKKTYIISRLVAITWLPNPLNLPCVCHRIETLDENGALYNGSDNLFWGTQKDNMQDMIKKGRDSLQNIFGTDNKFSKKINQYTKDGKFIKEWGNAREVQRELGINDGNIGSCCLGKLKSVGGFIWKYQT